MTPEITKWLDTLGQPENYYDPKVGGRFISNSHISVLLNDPASYGEPSNSTYQMDVGSLMHDLIQESIEGHEDLVKPRYTFIDEPREMIPYVKDQITTQEHKDCLRWRKSILDNKTVKNLLKGQVECEVPMIGELNGLPFKAKADCVIHSRKILLDWKTSSKTLDNFGGYGFDQWNYDSAYYIYKELALQTFGDEYQMIFIPVHKDSGKVGVYMPPEKKWWSGKDKVERAAKAYKLFVK